MMRSFFTFVMILISISSINAAADPDAWESAEAKQAFGQLPLYFIENQGLVDNEAVAYILNGADKTLYFTPDGITFALSGAALSGAEGDETNRWAVKLSFVAANPDVKPQGCDKQEAVFSIFKGKPEQWRTGIPSYTKLVYEDLWPGIDLVYSGSAHQLKYEFVVEPGADPEMIRLSYTGTSDVAITDSGTLSITTPVAGFEDGVPYAYQTVDGRQEEVAMKYRLTSSKEEGSIIYGFETGAFDRSKTLILDPVILIFCGYIGGVEYEEARDCAVDDLGQLHVVGFSKSPQSSFPVVVGPDLTYNGGVYGGDVFVAKLSADGTTLLYCGYIGGSDDDYGWGIALDTQGNAYVTGETKSTHGTFPVFVGPDVTYNGGRRDAFVAKVSANGMVLLYCGYIGGVEEDNGWSVAVDENGAAYVTAFTLSTETTLPVAVGPDLTHNGIWDTFVAKVKPDGTGLDYCGFIGGDGNDFGFDIDVDGSSAAYISGFTYSGASTFPVVGGPDLSHNGKTDAFIAKVRPDGTGLIYCGYIGGSEFDEVHGIDLDGQGNAYVTGWTSSTESTFPVLTGPDLTYNGWYWDAFVAKVKADGSGLDYCGYIGGDASEHCLDIAVDTVGNAYVTGRVYSTEATFPVIAGPDLTFNGGGTDAFVARVSADGSGLDYCGYIGGDKGDTGEGIAVDDAGAVYVAGATYSSENTFPVKSGPELTYDGDMDAFVAKVDFGTVVPDIKVNGQDGPLSIPSSQTAAVTISLDPGNQDEDPADWWVFVTRNSNNTWWWKYKSGWKKSSTPIRAAGATLRSVNDYSVYNSTLPTGSYLFTFAVDEKNNTYEGSYIDTVDVTVY